MMLILRPARCIIVGRYNDMLPKIAPAQWVKGDFFFPGSSWYAAVFIVVNAALGAGLLNFPQAFDQSGGIAVAIIIQAVSIS